MLVSDSYSRLDFQCMASGISSHSYFMPYFSAKSKVQSGDGARRKETQITKTLVCCADSPLVRYCMEWNPTAVDSAKKYNRLCNSIGYTIRIIALCIVLPPDSKTP